MTRTEHFDKLRLKYEDSKKMDISENLAVIVYKCAYEYFPDEDWEAIEQEYVRLTSLVREVLTEHSSHVAKWVEILLSPDRKDRG